MSLSSIVTLYLLHFFLKMGQSEPLFLYFRLFYCIVGRILPNVVIDGIRTADLRCWKWPLYRLYHLGDTRSCYSIMKGSLVTCLKKVQRYFLLVTPSDGSALALNEEVMSSNPALHHSQLKAMRTSFLGTIQRLGYLFCSFASQNKHLT